MFEDAYAKHKHWKKFSYTPEVFSNVIKDGAIWAEDFIKEFG
jgi:hypothetical protein